MRFHEIERKWDELFPGPLGAHTAPASIGEKRQLLIHVDSSAWLQQTGYLKPAILEKLRPLNIKDIRFMIGRVTKIKTTPKPEPLPRTPLSAADREFIETCISVIDDETIKDTFRRAITASFEYPNRSDIRK